MSAPKAQFQIVAVPDAAAGIHRGMALTIDISGIANVPPQSVIVKSRYALRDGRVRIVFESDPQPAGPGAVRETVQERGAMSEPFVIQPIYPDPIALPPMIFEGQRYPMKWVSAEATSKAVVVKITCYDGQRYRCDVPVSLSYDEIAGVHGNDEMLNIAYRRADEIYDAVVQRRLKNQEWWALKK